MVQPGRERKVHPRCSVENVSFPHSTILCMAMNYQKSMHPINESRGQHLTEKQSLSKLWTALVQHCNLVISNFQKFVEPVPCPLAICSSSTSSFMMEQNSPLSLEGSSDLPGKCNDLGKILSGIR